MQTIIFGIQNYWSSLLMLPKKVIMKIEQIMRMFLWKGPEPTKGGAKVAWEDLSCPREEGGLGIKRLEEWNIASMAKHVSNLCRQNPTSNWVVWARTNLLRGHSL